MTNKDRPMRSLFNYSQLAIALGAIGILIGVALQYVQFQYWAAPDLQAQKSKRIAQYIAGDIQAHLRDTQQMQLQASKHPNSLSALKGRNPQWHSTLASIIPHARRAFLFTKHDVPGLQSRLGYAIQESVADVFAGKTQSMNAIRHKNEIVLYWVMPIINKSDDIEGSLLIIYSPSWLKNSVGQLEEFKASLQLHQQVSGGKQFLLLSVGDASPSVDSEIMTINQNWQLSLQLNEPVVIDPLIYAPWGGALLFLLVAQFWLLMNQRRALLQNQLQLVQMLRTFSRSGELPSARFSLQSFADMAHQLRHLMSTSKLNHNLSAANDQEEPETRAPEMVSLRQPKSAVLAQPDVPDELAADEESDMPIVEDTDDEPESAQPDPEIPTISQSIFRAYDIRGIVGQDINEESFYWIGRAIGSTMMQRGFIRTSLAWDGRLSSPSLADSIQKGLCDSGCHVIRLGVQPSGLLYYATHELETPCGIMLTGSHNPPQYNGIKIVIDRQPLSQTDLINIYKRIRRQDLTEGNGQVDEQSIEQQYIDRIEGDISVGRDMKVVLDAGNGAAGPLVSRLFDQLNVVHIDMYCDVDGHFPNHNPDPSKAKNLRDLQKAVVEHKADFGLAFDGDGDRVTLVDNKGIIVWADKTLMLLTEDILPRYPGKDVLYDVKSSRHLPTMINKFGGRPSMWKTGHTFMKQRMHTTDAIVGAEFSGHFYFKDRWYGFDDGLYTAARLLEVISHQPQTTSELFTNMPEDVSTPEITLASDDVRKFEILKHLCKDAELIEGARVFTIDGLRMEFNDGWGLVRASNTTPQLTLRFAGDSEQVVQRIQQRVKQALTRHAPEIELSF